MIRFFHEVSWEINYLIQFEGIMFHETVEILSIVNQAWLGWLDTMWHDYSRWRDFPYSPENGHNAHGDLLFDLGGDDLSMGDTRLIIGKNCIGREAMMISLAAICIMKWSNKLVNIDPVFYPGHDELSISSRTYVYAVRLLEMIRNP